MSVTDESEFRRRRAEKEDDANKWTAKDALLQALEDIDGEDVTGLVVHYHIKNDDGGESPYYFAAGVDRPKHLAILEIAKQIAINDWLNK